MILKLPTVDFVERPKRQKTGRIIGHVLKDSNLQYADYAVTSTMTINNQYVYSFELNHLRSANTDLSKYQYELLCGPLYKFGCLLPLTADIKKNWKSIVIFP